MTGVQTCALPISALHLQPLPATFFLYLPLVLLAYCLMTQAVKVLYIRRFKTWL